MPDMPNIKDVMSAGRNTQKVLNDISAKFESGKIYALARALASNSPIIMADEPTGNLDEDTEAKIIEIFRDLAHKDNKIVVIVTHSRRVAEKADNVLTLRRGKLS